MNKLEKAKLNAEYQVEYQAARVADSFPRFVTLVKYAFFTFVFGFAGFIAFIRVTA